MLKNYTSQVTSSRSISHIEDILIKHGAENILKLIEDKRLVGIAFIIDIQGKKFPFKLPARIDCIEKYLLGKVIRLNNTTRERVRAQAERTAWKLLSDWVDIQMAMIDMDQVEFVQVFLPYMYDSNKEQTLFEKMKETEFAMLEDRGFVGRLSDVSERYPST